MPVGAQRKQNKAVERTLAHLDRLLGLQEELDEYRRVIGDLLVTLCCDSPGVFIEHGTGQKEEIRCIFKKIWELQRLAQKLQEGNEKQKP